jgi:histidine triad (HIT) family protein
MCIFCKIAAGEIPAQFLYESEKVVAFNDLDPQAPTHILIIPRAHFENAAELAASDSEAMSELIGAARELAGSNGLDGYRLTFNTGASAGQSVFHAHLHLLGGRAFAWPPG